MAGSIDMEQKGCESIGCYTFFVTLSYMTLTLDFQGQILEMLCLGNGRADWHGTKGMWVDRMLFLLCDLSDDFDLGFWRSDFKKKALS